MAIADARTNKVEVPVPKDKSQMDGSISTSLASVASLGGLKGSQEVALTTTPAALTIPSGAMWALLSPGAGATFGFGTSAYLIVSGSAAETTGAKCSGTRPTLLALIETSPSVFIGISASTGTCQVLYF